ncbi:hypothetical protein L596_022022 [Steinernema carpocapsae]|uniref:Peptidase A1 domain-containing protein n=1 Tax=Steinernema carpocapsae TaxID=34508 RepID=A0A4U5MKK7_STECR|nr:hypothetical protein L596_022022 [Steinernema carpocapsae]
MSWLPFWVCLGFAPLSFYFSQDDLKILTRPVNIDGQNYDFFLDTTSEDLQINLCDKNGVKNVTCFQSGNGNKPISDNQFISKVPISFAKTPLNGQFYSATIGLSLPTTSNSTCNLFFKALSKFQKRLFTLFLDREATHLDMAISSSHRCDRLSKSTIHVPVTSDKYWQFEVQKMYFGNLKVDLGQRAIIDTRTSFVGMPKDVFEAFNQTQGFFWDANNQAYNVDCNLRTVEELPHLRIKIQEGWLTLRPLDYVDAKHISNGRCVVKFQSSEAYDLKAEWFFGTPIITDYCVTFNFDNRTLGFTRNMLD